MPISAVDHSLHTPYSNPGQHHDLVAALPTDPDGLSAVVRNLIVHYRIFGEELPAETRDDVNARWLERMLDLDQSRHPGPLTNPRPLTERVQGCCRDMTLVCLGALRSHGIAARSRVGFAGYFFDGWHFDHVIVEAWLDGRWRRFDAQLEGPTPELAAPTDIEPCGAAAKGFVTAAQVWDAYRRRELDPGTYGVDPMTPGLRGERFIFDEVIYEVAHRFGDELLLWDSWGRIGEPDEPVSEADATWIDGVADLLLASDRGDVAAEEELLAQYRSDDGLHPGPVVLQASPYGDLPIEARLDHPS